MSSGDAAPATPLRPAVVGRDEELTRLTDFADLAVEHGARMVLLSGDAGIGKSTLTAHFLDQLRDSGWGTHVGHCIEYADRPLPFGPVVAVLRSLLLDDLERVDDLVGHHREDLAGLVPELGDGDVGSASLAGDVDRLFDAIAALLTRASEGRPIAFLIEDVHWSDAATRDLLTSLVHNLRSARVLMLVTERSGALEKGNPLRTWLAEQRRFPNVHSMELEGLGEEDLAAQVSSLTGQDADTSFVAELLERTGGNPYFAHELVVAHGQQRGELPTSLREFLTSRLSQLGDDEREVLRAVAIAGGSVAHPVLAGMLANLNLGPVIRTLFDTGILQVEGQTYDLSHALMREAVLEDVLPFEAAEMHARAAAALESVLGMAPALGDVAALATHYSLAGDHQQGLRAGVRAADMAAAVGAYDSAADIGVQAVEAWTLADRPDEAAGRSRRQLTVDAASWLAGAQRLPEALRLVHDAIETWAATLPPGERAQLLAKVSIWEYNAGFPDRARQLLAEAEGLVGDDVSPEAAQVHHSRSRISLFDSQIGPAKAAAGLTISIAREHGPRFELIDAMITNSLALGVTVDTETGVELVREARRLAMTDRLVAQVVRSYRIEFLIRLQSEGRSLAANRAVEDGLEYAKSHCGPRWRAELEHDMALALVECGRFSEARPLVEALLEAETYRHHGMLVAQTAALLELGVGDLEAARGHVSSSEEVAERFSGPAEEGWQARLVAELARREGDLDGAHAAIGRAIELQLPSDNVSYVRESIVELARLAFALRINNPEAAAVTSDRVLRLLRDLNYTGLANSAMAQLARSLAEAAVDPHAATWEVWARTAADLRQCGYEHDAAQAELTALELEPPDVAPRAAQEHAAAVHKRALEQGASWVAEWASHVGSRYGIRLTSAPPTAAESALEAIPHFLTERELEVMALLAEGLTNKAIGAALFVSPRTVSTHVSNILAKVGVSTRGEAGAAFRRLELERFLVESASA